MGKKYLIDTNVVIDLLANRFSEKATDWLEEVINSQEHCLSIINKIELLAFNGTSTEMTMLELFINESNHFFEFVFKSFVFVLISSYHLFRLG